MITDYELETVINFNEEEDTASVYTNNKKWWSAFERQKIEPFKILGKDFRIYIIPKKYVQIVLPKKKSKVTLLPKVPKVKVLFQDVPQDDLED